MPDEERVSLDPLDPRAALKALLQVKPASPLEAAQKALRDAETQFADDPTEENQRKVDQARLLVASERDRK